MKSSTKGLIYLVVGVLVLGAIFLVFMLVQTKDDPGYNTFLNMVEADQVEEVFVKNLVMEVRVKNGVDKSKFPTKSDYTVKIPSRQGLQEDLERIYQAKLESAATPDEKEAIKRIEVRYNDPNANSIWSYVVPALGVAALIIFGIFIFRAMSGSNKQAMNFGKSKARVNDNVKIRFNDVAGAEEEKEELAEIVEFLKNPQKFSQVGARIPKGVLLVGQPGTGKTLFAKAIAGEANVPFFSISGSDFVEMYVGVGASRVRDLFDQAKRNLPCIIFIDEIDAVGRQRGAGLGGGHDEREQTLNQLLVQMDGFETNEGIIIMAATNRADILDPALLRPGRFDRQIYVHIPDVRGREAILKVHARGKPISGDVDFKVLARITSGFTGADIENLLNEAAILCARDNRKTISMNDITEGINKVLMGPQKKSRIITEYDKRITAYHEAGHAIVAKKLKNCDPVQEVSIIPRGMAAGYTMTRPENDDQHESKSYLVDSLAMTMGGRAAEEVFIKEICTGAEMDIKQATKIARKMVTDWGMSDLGPVYLGAGHSEVFLGRDISSDVQYSESIAAKIDAAIADFITQAHQTALKIMNENKEIVEKMVRMLIEKETIYSDEVDMLFEGKSIEEIYQYMDNKAKNRKVPYTDSPQDEQKPEKVIR